MRILETRITNTHTKTGKLNGGIAFQHQICGQKEYLVSTIDQTVKYWADGISINETGNYLIDAKQTKPNGIFCGGASKSLTKKVHKSQVSEFTRINKIIEITRWDGFILVIQNEDAIEFFANVIEEAGFDFDNVSIVIEG